MRRQSVTVMESEGTISSIIMMQGWKLQGERHMYPRQDPIDWIRVSGLVQVAKYAVADWVVEMNPYEIGGSKTLRARRIGFSIEPRPDIGMELMFGIELQSLCLLSLMFNV
jgi:hypothetical protein